MGLIDYFRILKALIILFYYLIVCMNYFHNQNGKVPSRRNASRFQCRCRENNIEMTSTLFQNEAPSFASSSQISPHSSVNLSHTIESITNGSVG